MLGIELDLSKKVDDRNEIQNFQAKELEKQTATIDTQSR
jgi:hypothetical protein